MNNFHIDPEDNDDEISVENETMDVVLSLRLQCLQMSMSMNIGGENTSVEGHIDNMNKMINALLKDLPIILTPQ